MRFGDRIRTRPRWTRRPLWRRVGLGAAALGIASASALATTSIATVRPAAVGGVAESDNAPIILPAPVSDVRPAPPPTLPASLSAAGSIPTPAAAGCVAVPIVYYHYIRVNPNPRDTLGYQLSVTPANFRAQMDWLRLAGGHPVTLSQVMDALQHGRSLPSHPVVLTFDDGHDDFATVAVPILRREQFVATSFVVPGFLGTSTYMTEDQVREVVNQGMVVGAHTMHHVSLTSVSLQVAGAEIGASKVALERLTGRPVPDFAYPYGTYTQAIANVVARSGFRDAVATTWGGEQCLNNRYAMHRYEIVGAYNLAQFSVAAGIPPPPRGWSDPGTQSTPPATAAAAPSASPSASPSVSPSAPSQYDATGEYGRSR